MVHLSLRLVGVDIPAAPKRHQLKNLEEFFSIQELTMKEFTITKAEEGQTLFKYLCKLLPQAPASLFHKSFRKKNITWNDEKCTGKEILREKDNIKIWFSDETFHTFSEKKNADPSQKKSAFPFSRRIIYEDAHILIVDKPAGILTQSDNSNELSLNDALLDYCHYNNHSTAKPSVCNRLDRNTSGIVLCGKTVKGLQMLNEIIKNRTLHKYYRCIVLGETKEQDTLKGFLIKNESANQVTIITEQKDNAVPIETRYKRISTMEKAGNICSLLEVRLITGRPHQIRAHLTSIGHPILGDRKYRNKKSIEISKALHIPHQLLCACSITFPKIKGTFDYLSGKNFITTLHTIK